MPQQLLVPLFQRPYVWSREMQGEPLWEDVTRLAEKRLAGDTAATHFLGAVVLQQQPNHVGALAVRSIIDGQQRLTTLQLLLDSIRRAVESHGFDRLARRLRNLTENGAEFLQDGDDTFKVWPTNRDRPAYRDVMSTAGDIDYDELEHSQSKLSKAHRYFHEQASSWLQLGGDTEDRAEALVEACMSQLQIVAIELLQDEDAQEIFETLNARGTPLTAADLIKNFVFQRLDLDAQKTEKLYNSYWSTFETPFWEQDVTSGRIKYSRSSLFLNHWLIARTIDDVPAREVFTDFKRYIDTRPDTVAEMLPLLRASADRYRGLIEASTNRTKELSREELFAYRTGSLDSEIVKPILVWLSEPEQHGIPTAQREKCLATIESWMVRRAIVRAKSSGVNRFIIDLLSHLNKADREHIGDVTEAFLSKQNSSTTYWPGNHEVRRELESIAIYRRLRRGRLRMILAALEDDARGFTHGRGFHESRVVRDTCSIEHIMPQNWSANWGTSDTDEERAERDRLVHQLGNLTLVTQALNSSVSNAAWDGPKGKREALHKHTSLHLTRQVVDSAPHDWTPQHISQRTSEVAERVLDIWPVPAGHVGAVKDAVESTKTRYSVEVADLIRASMLEPGTVIVARSQAVRGREAVIGADGSIYVDGIPYGTLSGAAKAVTGSQSEAGWWFWLLDPATDRCMSDLRSEFLNRLDDSGDDD